MRLAKTMVLFGLALGLGCGSGRAKAPAPTSPSAQIGDWQRFGVNISGCEFKVETCPRPADVALYADAGAQAIRLPVRADRLETPDQLRRLERLVAATTRRGIYVIIDDHRYRPIGDPTVRAFWLRIGPLFRGNRLVAFDLQNEPRGGTWESYGREANMLIGALRAAGIDNDILLEWRQSSGANRADKKEPADKPCESAFCSLDRAGGLRDPLGRTLMSPHSYWDSDGSGRSGYCRGDTSAKGQLGAVTAAARRRGVRLFLGEFAFGKSGVLSPVCAKLGQEMFAYMRANRDVWAGGTLWGGGPAWSARYTFRLEKAKDRAATFDTAYGRMIAESWRD